MQYYPVKARIATKRHAKIGTHAIKIIAAAGLALTLGTGLAACGAVSLRLTSGPATTAAPAPGSCAAVNAFLAKWAASQRISTVAGAEADMTAFKTGFSNIGIPLSSDEMGWAAANVLNTTTKVSFDLQEYHGLYPADRKAWNKAVAAIGTDCHAPASVIHSLTGS